MSTSVILQVFTISCFIALVFILFNEKSDYLTYSIMIMVIAGVFTAFFLEEARHIEFYINTIEWDVIFFLIGMFTIVEILNEKLIFQEISKRIVKKYQNKPRKMFYIICIVSTLTATILEDLSVAIIFGPIIIIACRDIKINPTPFLLGMTICINLASTLTPFGSAENVLIVSALDLDFLYFVKNFGLYFVISTTITLFLLDKIILRKFKAGEYEEPICIHGKENPPPLSGHEQEHEHIFYDDNLMEAELSEVNVKEKVFRKNVLGLLIFIILLVILPNIYLPALIGALVFVFLNPVKSQKKGETSSHPSISYYFKKVDYKLIYFFICLFILVGLMEENGLIDVLGDFILNLGVGNIFFLSVIILLVTSVLSGFMDNAPVTIIFLPIIGILISDMGLEASPLIIAFVLGINLGGNFLPQGSACDMMTLEIANEHCVEGLTYRRLFKIGGMFALFHVLLGIIYLAFIVFVIP
ncbi:MAG: TRAP transporter large permease subunit [Candidatus Lokiarchaeota archaeon]|nr:TRAP transporter large permease subunit [Candidatus Lokiarchaeota archaeon]